MVLAVSGHVCTMKWWACRRIISDCSFEGGFVDSSKKGEKDVF